jgi:TolB-like protein
LKYLKQKDPSTLRLLQELQRRNVFRVVIGYVVSCWLIAQVADLVLEAIGAPEWVMQSILLMLALGFPVVVFFSWVYEVTPEGIKREAEIDRSQSITHITGRRLDKAIMVMLILALGYFIWESRFSGRESVQDFHSADGPMETTANGSEKPSVADESGKNAVRSIAVLPFVNMSSDEEQEYFSDGLTEEILNRLSQLPELRVPGRTSSFKYKGQNLDLREIAAELGVAYVLEGSVRRSGERMRITAQLIHADDGTHLWSQSYDRKIDDIFRTQDEIAEQVATSLDVMLDESARHKMRSVGVPSLEAFIAYQKGWKIFVDGHAAKDMMGELRRANEYFEEATELYPGFGDAWYWQADYYHHILMDDPSRSREELSRAAQRNLELLTAAAENAPTARQKAFSELTRVLFSDDWTGIRTYLQRAVDAQTCTRPNWSELLGPFGLGDQLVRLSDKYMACEGGLRSGAGYNRRIEALLLTGRRTEALEMANEAIEQLGQSDGTHFLRAWTLLALGSVEEAVAESAMMSRGLKRAGHWPAIANLMAGNIEFASELADEFLHDSEALFNSKLTLLKFMGRQQEVEALAAEIDEHPAGHLILAGAHLDCLCGPMFDLDVTPNFKARLQEGGLIWPPETIIDPAAVKE